MSWQYHQGTGSFRYEGSGVSVSVNASDEESDSLREMLSEWEQNDERSEE